MTRSWKRLALQMLVVAALLIGAPIPQAAHVTVVSADRPVGALRLKLTRSALGDCSGRGGDAVTDTNGRARLSHLVWRTALALVIVTLQDDTLCIREGNHWRPIWASRHAIAFDELALRCDLARAPDARALRGEIRGVCARH